MAVKFVLGKIFSFKNITGPANLASRIVLGVDFSKKTATMEDAWKISS